MKKRLITFFAVFCALALITAFTITASAGEAAETEDTPREAEEKGVQEIQQLIEMTNVEGTEGMGLEELTEAFNDKAMSDYYDRQSGFSMQYPSIFIFDEEKGTVTAFTADGKASLTIESMPVAENQLTEEKLLEAIKLGTPDAEPRKYEQNNCLRVDGPAEDGKSWQTDLYLIGKKSFHHVTLQYPKDEKETYYAYIEYIVNTMATETSEQG